MTSQNWQIYQLDVPQVAYWLTQTILHMPVTFLCGISFLKSWMFACDSFFFGEIAWKYLDVLFSHKTPMIEFKATSWNHQRTILFLTRIIKMTFFEIQANTICSPPQFVAPAAANILLVVQPK